MNTGADNTTASPATRDRSRTGIPEEDRLRMVALRLPNGLILELKRIAADRGKAYQSMSRQVLIDYVQKAGQKAA